MERTARRRRRGTGDDTQHHTAPPRKTRPPPLRLGPHPAGGMHPRPGARGRLSPCYARGAAGDRPRTVSARGRLVVDRRHHGSGGRRARCARAVGSARGSRQPPPGYDRLVFGSKAARQRSASVRRHAGADVRVWRAAVSARRRLPGNPAHRRPPTPRRESPAPARTPGARPAQRARNRADVRLEGVVTWVLGVDSPSPTASCRWRGRPGWRWTCGTRGSLWRDLAASRSALARTQASSKRSATSKPSKSWRAVVACAWRARRPRSPRGRERRRGRRLPHRRRPGRQRLRGRRRGGDAPQNDPRRPRRRRRRQLERALILGSRLDGHLVQGHVDARGEIVAVEPLADSHEVVVRYPETFAGYLIPKGSITVDGIRSPSRTWTRRGEPPAGHHPTHLGEDDRRPLARRTGCQPRIRPHRQVCRARRTCRRDADDALTGGSCLVPHRQENLWKTRFRAGFSPRPVRNSRDLRPRSHEDLTLAPLM